MNWSALASVRCVELDAFSHLVVSGLDNLTGRVEGQRFVAIEARIEREGAPLLVAVVPAARRIGGGAFRG